MNDNLDNIPIHQQVQQWIEEHGHQPCRCLENMVGGDRTKEREYEPCNSAETPPTMVHNDDLVLILPLARPTPKNLYDVLRIQCVHDIEGWAKKRFDWLGQLIKAAERLREKICQQHPTIKDEIVESWIREYEQETGFRVPKK